MKHTGWRLNGMNVHVCDEAGDEVSHEGVCPVTNTAGVIEDEYQIHLALVGICQIKPALKVDV